MDRSSCNRATYKCFRGGIADSCSVDASYEDCLPLDRLREGGGDFGGFCSRAECGVGGDCHHGQLVLIKFLQMLEMDVNLAGRRDGSMSCLEMAHQTVAGLQC